MEIKDKDKFAVLMAALHETFGIEATKPRLNGYWFGLSDLTIAEVQTAVEQAMRTCERLPVPGQLRQLSSGGSGEALALEAWLHVQKAMPLGSYKHIDFADGTINAVIRHLGGWPAMFDQCATTDQEKWYRHEFLKTYAKLCHRQLSAQATRPLEGLSQQQLVNGQLSDPVPVRHGCEAVPTKAIEQTASAPLLTLKNANEVN